MAPASADHQQLGKQFIADNRLSFTFPRLEERFVAQFVAVTNAAPKCESLDAILEHTRLYLLRSCVTEDDSIDVEEACRAWPQYPEKTVVNWLSESDSPAEGALPELPMMTSSVSSISSSNSLAIKECVVAEAIAEICSSASTGSSSASTLAGARHNSSLCPTNPFIKMFQSLIKGLIIPHLSVSPMYVIWKITCGPNVLSMSPAEVEDNMKELVLKKFGYGRIDRGGSVCPTEKDRSVFELQIVVAHGVEFTSEVALRKLRRCCRALRGAPRAERRVRKIHVFSWTKSSGQI